MSLKQSLAQLLALPTFRPSADARLDLASGNVDPRLVEVLLVLAQEHSLDISIIKTGHPLGPTTPGGFTNSHYYYRAVDITAVDGKSLLEYPTNPDVLAIRRILRSLSPQARPDHIFGPEAWQASLGYTASAGFRSDAFHNQILVGRAMHISCGRARKCLISRFLVKNINANYCACISMYN